MFSKTPAKPSLVLISLSGAELKNRDMQQKTVSSLQYRQENVAMLSQLNRSRDNVMAQSIASALTNLSNYIKTNVPTLSVDYSINQCGPNEFGNRSDSSQSFHKDRKKV